MSYCKYKKSKENICEVSPYERVMGSEWQKPLHEKSAKQASACAAWEANEVSPCVRARKASRQA